MKAEGVPSRAYFSPIHLQPYVREMFGDLRGTLPVTESIATRTLALHLLNARVDSSSVRAIDFSRG